MKDLDAARDWYHQVLGLEEIRRWDPFPVMIGVGGTVLALFPATAAADPDSTVDATERPGWRRVAWRTDAAGFETAQRHLESLSIPFRGPVDHRIARSIYFADPDGNPLEITTYE